MWAARIEQRGGPSGFSLLGSERQEMAGRTVEHLHQPTFELAIGGARGQLRVAALPLGRHHLPLPFFICGRVKQESGQSCRKRSSQAPTHGLAKPRGRTT